MKGGRGDRRKDGGYEGRMEERKEGREEEKNLSNSKLN
jgi:hypothetical protein